MKRRELLTGMSIGALAVLGLVDKNALQAASPQDANYRSHFLIIIFVT